MQITFTVLMRLNMAALLNEVKGGVDDENRLAARTALRKIEIPEDEQAKYIIQLPGTQGRVALNPEEIRKAPELTVALEKSEARKCISVITGCTNFGPKDDEWFQPLLDALRAGLQSN